VDEEDEKESLISTLVLEITVLMDGEQLPNLVLASAE